MAEPAVRLAAGLADRYRLEREIGAGGMATVYLAHDLKHHRRVAVKVLRPELGAVLGVERFLAEIQVTATLQHPHLLPLFDSGEVDGLLFYVMPYVEGESLRARLERERQFPVEEAVRITLSVASALDYAHRHGVIHRDLKPENILLHDGQPLVADFGIALAVSNAGGGRVTQTGLSLGTPQYMSPEQATGDSIIDGRSDIYSLAAVLYEMLTGEPPHVGATSQAVIARLLTEKPRSVRAGRPTVPPHVDAAVERALQKLPADRFGTVKEFADMLAGRVVVPEAAPAVREPAAPGRSWGRAARHPLTAGALALAVVSLAGMLATMRSAAPSGAADVTAQFEFRPPQEEGELQAGTVPPFAFSRDGRVLVYRTVTGGVDQRAHLYYRPLKDGSSRRLMHADGMGSMALSPDGRTLAYLSGSTAIYRLALDGGSTPVLAGRATTLQGIAWAGPNLVAGHNSGPLQIVPAAGGTPRDLLALDTASGEHSQRRPIVLADEETVLYWSWQGAPANSYVGVASLRTGRSARLDIQGIPLGMVDDLLVYHDVRNTVFGVSFDVRRWRVTGSPIALVDSVNNAVLSHAGTLMFLRTAGAAVTELVELDMEGNTRAVLPVRQRFGHPRYSPDSRRILVTVTSDSIPELWIHDTRAGTFSPAVRGFYGERGEWSPDGRDLLFASRQGGLSGLWRQRADGTGPRAPVQRASERGQPVQGIFTPDGRHLVYRTGFNGDDVWYRAWEGDTASHPLAADPSFLERNTAISPDGRWAAYASDESGTYQVYVRPFPGPGPRYAITVDGGDTPVWSPDGRRIYYVNGPRFEEATLTLTPDFSVTRRALFEHRAYMEAWWRNWDLSPDGRHFLLVRAETVQELRPRAIVIHNWAADVRARRVGQSSR
jgi:eukaryotic-like serine/threonine-protein kinase